MWPPLLLITLIPNLVASDPVPTHPEDNIIKQANQKRVLSYMQLPGVVRQQLRRFSTDFPKIEHDKDLIKNLPESFDPRDKWPNCPSLKEIRDQGRCGACWALSAVSAMTDRVCIYSNATRNFHVSAEDLVTCGDGQAGCGGGDPYGAWRQWVQNGFVSGGNYGSQEGCRPYSIPTCPNHMKDCTNYLPTPKCKRSCRNRYNVSYEDDKFYGKKAYLVDGVENMMAELYKNGPFVVVFRVYADLADYSGGVYQHVHGKQVSSHAVKLMGWGVEEGKKYWLLANSWGTGFGEGGYFKILRGTNECNIETYNSAGEPRLSDN